MTHYKKILNIALPAMGENFLQMLMGMVDGYLVAHLGLVAISGVSVAGNIITIYQAIFMALGAAVASVISKSLGAKDEKQLAYHATESLQVTLLLSLLLGAISLFSGEKMLVWLGTQENVAQAGGLYLGLVGGSIFLLGLTMTLGTLIRVKQNPRMPLYISLLSNVLNIIFSSFAIFVWNLGIAGVAFGTMLARLVGVLILWSYLEMPFAPFHWSIDRELLRLALPAAGERLMMRIGDVVIVAIIVAFGTEAVAGNAIGETLTQFNYMPALGVATATVMMVAQATGKKNWQEVRQLTRCSYWLSLAFMFPIGLLVYILAFPLTQIYTLNSQAIAASLVVVLFSALCMPFTAGTLIYTAAWQGLGNARLPFYATTVGMWLIRIVTGYLLGITMGFGLVGVWLATLFDNAFRWLVLGFSYKRNIKKIGEISR